MTELIISDNPFSALSGILNGTYRNGALGLVAESVPDGLRLLENKITLLKPLELPKEHIRLIIGIGSEEYVNYAKLAAKGRRLILLPNAPYRAAFNDKAYLGYQKMESGTLEAVIMDGEMLSETCGVLICSLFGSLTDVIDILAGRGAENADLKALRGELLSAVFNPERAENMLKKLCAAEEHLSKSGYTGGAETLKRALSVRGKGKIGADCDFFTFYLINILSLQFTKREINGILLCTDRVSARAFDGLRPRVPIERKPRFAAGSKDGILPTEAELRNVALAFGKNEEKKDINAACVLESLIIASEHTEWDGLSYIIAQSGFIEGLLENGIKD